MFRYVTSFRSALLALAFVTMSISSSHIAHAADMPGPSPMAQTAPALTRADYLERFAELMMLRARFSAVLEGELPDLITAEAQAVGMSSPTPERVAALRRDLTAELYYYVVNLKYLIWAEGAIWPEDRPASTYRNDALSALSEIAGELTGGDVLALDVDHLLHRLEQVNAWTEGQPAPVEDWFDPAERQKLIEAAPAPIEGPTKT